MKSNSLQQTSTINLPVKHQQNHSFEMSKNEVEGLQSGPSRYEAYINNTATKDAASRYPK